MVDAMQLVDMLNKIDEQTAVAVITQCLQHRPELAPPVVTFACPDLTYPPAKALTERRSNGVVKSFSPQKGFGFIECVELHAVFGYDVFVHKAQIGNYVPGTPVSFAVMLNKDNRPQAYDLMPPQEKEQSSGSKSSGKANNAANSGNNDPMMQAMMQQDMISTMAQMGMDPSQMMMYMDPNGGKGMGKTLGKGKLDEQVILGNFIGTIKSFNDISGYGFIDCPDLKAKGYQDVFLHQSQRRTFAVGNMVQFTSYLNSKGQPQSKDLQAVGGIPDLAGVSFQTFEGFDMNALMSGMDPSKKPRLS